MRHFRLFQLRVRRDGNLRIQDNDRATSLRLYLQFFLCLFSPSFFPSPPDTFSLLIFRALFLSFAPLSFRTLDFSSASQISVFSALRSRFTFPANSGVWTRVDSLNHSGPRIQMYLYFLRLEFSDAPAVPDLWSSWCRRFASFTGWLREPYFCSVLNLRHDRVLQRSL